MDPATAAMLAGLGLQLIFAIMDQANATPEELDALYNAEKAKFLANKPEALPDV